MGRFCSFALLAVCFLGAALPLRAASNPEAEEAYRHGRSLFVEERYEAARDAFEQALSLAPATSLYAQWLGRAYGLEAQNASLLSRPGLATRSRDALEKAVALDPDNVGARSDLAAYYHAAPSLLGGGLAKAQAQVAEIARRDPYLGHVRAGDLLVDDGKYPEAEKEYLAAAALDARRAQAHERLGFFYTEGKLYPKAFAQYDALLAIDPDQQHALYGLGKLAALTGQRQAEGEAALRRFLDQYQPDPDEGPPPARAHYFLGRLLAARSDKAGARTEYEAALRLRPLTNGRRPPRARQMTRWMAFSERHPPCAMPAHPFSKDSDANRFGAAAHQHFALCILHFAFRLLRPPNRFPMKNLFHPALL